MILKLLNYVVRFCLLYGSTFSLQSLIAIGALFGGIIGGKAVDLIGRKFTIIVGTIPFALGWLLIFLAKNRAMLYTGRIFTGVGCGIETLAVAVSYYRYEEYHNLLCSSSSGPDSQLSSPQSSGFFLPSVPCTLVLFRLLVQAYTVKKARKRLDTE